MGAPEPAGPGWGQSAPRGGRMLSGSSSSILAPSLGVGEGFSPGYQGVAWLGAIGGHLLPPPVRAGDGMWGGTTGARRCPEPARSQGSQDDQMGNHLQPSGRKLPSPRGFGSGTYVCEGREDVSHLGGCRWVLTRLVAFLLSPPCNGLVSFCSLFLPGILAAWIPQPKNDRHQHLGGTRPGATAGAGKLSASLHPLQRSCEWGAGLLSLLPLTTVRGRSQLRWPSQLALGCSAGAWTPEEGVPRLLRQSRLLADRLWLGRLSCCWPARSDLLVLVTSSCFLIWIPVPPFRF